MEWWNGVRSCFLTKVRRQGLTPRFVSMVAIIALAHKVIIIDFKALPSYTLLGIGTIIVSLTISYYLIKKVRLEKKKIYQDIDLEDI